tara:strand:+ start:382 stop:1782 length:1401 start_codon:yes stop_codon:yes gene_type:complete
VFSWSPQTGQAGSYSVTFSATDGALETSQSVAVRVNPASDKDGDGLKDDWELEHFGNLDSDGSGDQDADGRTDREEFEQNTNPVVAEVAPGVPQILSPIFDAEVLADASAPLLPLLSVTNGAHSNSMAVQYRFEVYSDASLSTLVASASVDEAGGSTTWSSVVADLVEEQAFVDNRLYYWRARAETGALASEWVGSRFFINTANDSPSDPQISQPADLGVVDQLQPVLVVTNASDRDRDSLNYGFDLYLGSDTQTPLYSISGLLAGSEGVTQWQVPALLEEDTHYLWQAWAEDEHGQRSRSVESTFIVSTLNNAPTTPSIASPANQQQVSVLGAQNSVALRVANAQDPEWQPLSYRFELDRVNTFDSVELQSSGVQAEGGGGQTDWSPLGLIENARYYWRVKASDGEVDSGWVQAEFLVNTFNDAPAMPTAINPGMDAVVETLQPTFELSPAQDPDSAVVTGVRSG